MTWRIKMKILLLIVSLLFLIGCFSLTDEEQFEKDDKYIPWWEQQK